jgi:hypothetical protein
VIAQGAMVVVSIIAIKRTFGEAAWYQKSLVRAWPNFIQQRGRRRP